MTSYEGFFIFPPDHTPEVRKKQDKTLEDLIGKFQGTIVEIAEGGRKPLGYPVKKSKEGFFVWVHFQMDPLKVNELRYALSLQEDFLKFMITRKKIVSAQKKSPEKSRPQPVPPAQPVATAQPK